MNLFNDFLNTISDTEVTTTSAIFKLMLSLLLGGIVGFERKRKGQVAGARTFALISMGATLAMIISIYIPQVYLGLKNGDPGRVAAQVITGVGFLGAGAIIQTKGSIRGLTTAAGIWMVAALGLAVGVGLYVIAIISTILILFTLVSLEQYERRTNLDREGKIIHLKATEIVEDLTRYEKLLGEYKVSLHNVLVEYNYSEQKTDLKFIVLSRSTTDFVSLFPICVIFTERNIFHFKTRFDYGIGCPHYRFGSYFDCGWGSDIAFQEIETARCIGLYCRRFFSGSQFRFFPTIVDEGDINLWAELGIIVLLFSLGLEFSFKKLFQVGASAVLTALVVVSGMMLAGYGAGRLLHFTYLDSIFLGAMLSMSSTTIIIKAFTDLNLRKKAFTNLVFGVLIVEDLFAVVMMVILSSIAVKNSFEGAELLESIAKLVFFLIIWFVVGISILPLILKKHVSF